MPNSSPRERGLILDGESVRAVLEGRKWQHRVPVRPQPRGHLYTRTNRAGNVVWYGRFGEQLEGSDRPRYGLLENIRCPLGRVGDTLYVKERWYSKCDDLSPDHACCVRYGATDDELLEHVMNGKPKWRGSATMPRWASRLTLEITRVRVERVGDISVDDVWAEGVRRCVYRHGSKPHITFCDDGPDGFVPDPMMPEGGRVYPPVAAFGELWEAKHGATSWNENEWVFAIDFKVIEKGAVSHA